jgi:hypothetical protein
LSPAEAVSAVDQLVSLSRKVQIQEMVKLMKAVVPEFIGTNSRFEELGKVTHQIDCEAIKKCNNGG